MPRPRAFDWDEAARLYAEHGTYSAVARIIGVSNVSIRRALRPDVREQNADYQRTAKNYMGTCPDCGGPASTRYRQSKRCSDCANKNKAHSVRPDTLRCCYCRLWLPDESFPLCKSRVYRRGRHGQCSACGRVAKADHRRAHPEQERAAYERRKAKRQADRARLNGHAP